jgi:membrane-anchored mycosin MYCP
MNGRPSSAERWTALLLWIGVSVLPATGAAAAPKGPLVTAPTSAACAAPSGIATGSPSWGQGFVDGRRIWPISNGAGVLVAVISSGVDSANGQLSPEVVDPGLDLLGAGGPADDDCDGRGTFVAGLIAGRPAPQTSFFGLAPGARILPVRVVQKVSDGNQVTEVGGEPDRLARAVSWSVTKGARVICLTVSTGTDSPALRSAVDGATRAGALVVAGGALPEGGDDEQTRYPAAYPEVLAVGAVAEDGSPLPGSDQGQYLDVVAPAGGLVSTAPVGDQDALSRNALGHTVATDDPAGATALVAAAAALVMAYRPQLDAQDVARRLVGTAYAAAGPRTSGPTTGVPDAPRAAPVLFAAAAVSEHLVDASQPIDLTRARPAADPSEITDPERRALAVTGGVLVVLALSVTTVLAVRERRSGPA